MVKSQNNMSNSNTIFIIHSKDADQHLGKLQEILEDMKSENRIDSYSTLKSNSVEEKSFEDLGPGDMVILLLTLDLEPYRASIESILLDLRDKEPNCKIAEVIVDQIPYEPQFIAFPSDLEPIRTRENMDAAWNDTKNSLKDFFPVREEPEPATPWKKYLLILLGVIVLVALVIWGIGKFGGEPQADFSYRVLDPVRGDVFSNAEDCYVPCKVFFNNKSFDNKNLRWELQDTTIVDESDPEFVFMNTGTYDMSLVAIDGEKENKATKTISLKAPPQAAFEIEGEGCMAPCDLTFNNTSQNASKFTWAFTGASINNSDEENPGKIEYTNPGIFQVKLIAENEDGIKAETIKEVEIQEDESPFAAFSYKRIDKSKKLPYKYRFISNSKNAGQHRWEISRQGASGSDVQTDSVFDYTFNQTGIYSVKLTITGNNPSDTDDTFKNININKYYFEGAYDATILKEVMRNKPNFGRFDGL